MTRTTYGLWHAFKKRRLEMGLNQTELGKVFGVTRGAVQGWEQGLTRIASEKICLLIRQHMGIRIPEFRIALKPHEGQITKRIRASKSVKNRPLDRDTIDLVIRYYFKGVSTTKIALELNRDVDVIARLVEYIKKCEKTQAI